MIAQRIKTLRRALNMTQTEFSKALGLTQGHMTSIENGKRNITGRTVMSICRTYNVNEDWLCNGEGEMFAIAGKNSLKQLSKEYHLDSQEILLLSSYLEMAPKQRRIFTRFLSQIAGKFAENSPGENTSGNEA
ncbi:MAG: helix-turn-helix transcriptional regulator [Clostridiales bacterium]|nr:helix-turn-helix transcriptional regulator [Clostridiales bacterium]